MKSKLCVIQNKLNQSKCIFTVPEGGFGSRLKDNISSGIPATVQSHRSDVVIVVFPE